VSSAAAERRQHAAERRLEKLSSPKIHRVS
jgi:hypothetical protein